MFVFTRILLFEASFLFQANFLGCKKWLKNSVSIAFLTTGKLFCRSLSDIKKDSWLKPFHKCLWLALIGTTCIVFIAIWWLDRKSPQGYHYMFKDSKEEGFTLLGALWPYNNM